MCDAPLLHLSSVEVDGWLRLVLVLPPPARAVPVAGGFLPLISSDEVELVAASSTDEKCLELAVGGVLEDEEGGEPSDEEEAPREKSSADDDGELELDELDPVVCLRLAWYSERGIVINSNS